MIRNLFSRKRWRLFQLLTGFHRVHHPRWSFGWTMPFTNWVRFEYQHDGVYSDIPTMRPGHWKKCAKDSYHDSTASGVY